MPVRYLTPFEKNHLLRAGFSLENLEKYGEMPVEYITQTALFAGKEWKVTPDVLIPRLETEELLDILEKKYVTTGKPFSFLEVGTGSGALGLSVLSAAESQKIACTAVLLDISEKALTVAQENFHRIFPKGLQYGKIEWVKSDLLDSLQSLADFNLCLANLPYIPHERITELQPSVKDFEPVLALDGGKEGFELIARLILQLQERKFSGETWLEVDDTHTKEVFQKYFPGLDVTCLKDNFGKNRFAFIK